MPGPLAGGPLGFKPLGMNTLGAVLANTQEPYMFGLGTHTFTAPKSGYWKFVAWGRGGSTAAVDTTGAGSGGYAEKTVRLLPSQTVSVAILDAAGTTTLTFPDGSTVVCGAGGPGSAPAGGTATGGDVNIAGSINGVAGGGTNGGKAGQSGGSAEGGGAPANLPYRGGDGGDNSSLLTGGVPGGGGAAGGAAHAGGGALVIVSFIRD